jgi:hypothetical protein
MARRRRREFNIFSIAFLAVMTCGFGAVILFFMITNANMSLEQERILEDTSAEVDRMQLQVLAGRRAVVELRDELADLVEQRAILRGLHDQLVAEIDRTADEFVETTEQTLARQQTIERLQADLAALRTETERLSAASITPEQAGDRIRAFTGDGDRQYVTGMRMGGERVVILVNVSTSMLDRTVVNILRRRNMSPEQQMRAPKWRQTVDTVDWITTQMQPGTQFQIIAFNDEAYSLIEGSDGRWLTNSDGSEIQQAIDRLRTVLPGGGTNLHAAFNAVRELQPRPDNIFLIIDKLPTRSEVLPARSGVTGRERLNHFSRAVRLLPVGVPVNTILLAMEGDPQAAPAYWTLAIQTGGSLLAPADDWP